MRLGSRAFADVSIRNQNKGDKNRLARRSAVRRASLMILSTTWLFGLAPLSVAHADGLGRATAAYEKSNYVRAVRTLTPLARRGNARAQGILGFMYENGFGVPQTYDVAADLYQRAAAQGDAFAQARLGLLYDKGHGIPQDAVISYKWLNLAAAHASRRERDYYLRLRNAVASKMSAAQIIEGQRLALSWVPQRW